MVSLVLVIAALFIVFTYIGPLLFGDKDAGGGSSVSTSQGTGGQSSSQSGQDASQPDPGASSSGDSSQTQTPSVTVTSITLSRTDFTLAPGEIYQITATLTPDGVSETVTWSSSDTSLATVDEYGNVENVNQGTSLAKAVITATVGGQTAQCDVYCPACPDLRRRDRDLRGGPGRRRIREAPAQARCPPTPRRWSSTRVAA